MTRKPYVHGCLHGCVRLYAIPGTEDAVVRLELSEEAIVGLNDGPAFSDVAKRFLKCPALLLH